MVSPLAGKPRWLRVTPPTSAGYREMRARMQRLALHTVCQEANCPNIGGCWQQGSAAFLILGPRCTRRCTFCNVERGLPAPPDPAEPERLALAVREMGLRHVVITSVTRDDLEDGGAGQFAACLLALKARDPTVTVEVLTPDFRGKPHALAQVLDAGPTVFNHNVETVPRLYREIRPAADYHHSLALLRQAAASGIATKSGIMLGLGEEIEEVEAVLADLRTAGVALLTIGQYLRPSLQHQPVVSYPPPEHFAALRQTALAMGFQRAECHPLARSSFHAGSEFGVHST